MKLLSTGLLLAAVGILAACSDLSSVGSEGDPCNEKGFCRKGLTCNAKGVCVNPASLPHEDGGGTDGSVPADTGSDVGNDTGTDTGVDVGIDGVTDGGGDGGADGGPDAQVADTGTDGATDAGPDAEADVGGDTGVADDTGLDSSIDDIGTTNDAATDTGTVVDTGVTDAGETDAGQPDTGVTDVGTADTGAPDSGCAPDCTGKCGGASDSCGGTCTGTCQGATACQGGLCVHCGDYAEPCCTSDVCNGTNVCNDGTCVSDTCVGKGDFTLCKLVEGTPDRSYDICIGGSCISPGCGGVACNTSGSDFPIPDTNQRKCYDNTAEMTCPTSPCLLNGSPQFCGQDAQYGWDVSNSFSNRYLIETAVPEQPTIFDTVTGLEWTACFSGKTGPACAGGGATTINWSDAITYCDTLDWGGHTGWHLPSMVETTSICNYADGTRLFDVFSFVQRMWTMDTSAGSTGYAWTIESNCQPYHLLKQDMNTVICVRGDGLATSHGIITDATNPAQKVYLDQATGLSWTGVTETQATWASALMNCEAKTWGSYSDWRLPSIAELRSIVSTGVVAPASRLFGMQTVQYWSSTTFYNSPTTAITVDFSEGEDGQSIKTNNAVYTCVRGGKLDMGCTNYGGRLGVMCNVPAGPFQMGCNSAVDTECQSQENPYHGVTVPAYKIDKYEVTASEYKACVTDSGCTAANTTSGCNYNVSGKENHPINCVDWYQATAYCTWAGKRLPTEAEWEKAARGTDGRKYTWGNSALDCNHAVQNATVCGNSGTATVGSKPPGASPYGAEDMAGNVLEWVEDDSHGTYTGAPSDGSAWIETPRVGNRVARGGSWYSTNSVSLRASNRGWASTNSTNEFFGFRCAVSP